MSWDQLAQRAVQEFATGGSRPQSFGYYGDISILKDHLATQAQLCSVVLLEDQDQARVRRSVRVLVSIGDVEFARRVGTSDQAPNLFEDLQDLTLGVIEEAIEMFEARRAAATKETP